MRRAAALIATLALAGCTTAGHGGDDGAPVGARARMRHGPDPVAAPPTDVGNAEDPAPVATPPR